jgi:hypothetical protein
MSEKKEADLLAQEQPQDWAQTKEPTNNVTVLPALVNPLRELRLKKAIKAVDMVSIVRRLYTRYDRHLQSKCEHTDKYGIELCKAAMDALITTYAPEELPPEKKPEFRNLPCRISCRMTVRDYNLLMDRIRADGFQTTQDWLLSHIKKYLKLKGAYQ